MATNKKANSSKTRVGNSSLTKKSNLFTKRNGLIVAALAAIAGLAFVALSFAGGSNYKDFQYSYMPACGYTKANPDGGLVDDSGHKGPAGNNRCYSYSANAFVYRLYKGVLRRNPDPSGYAYWTQKLAGDQVGYEKVVRQFLSLNEAKTKLSTPELKDNTAFVNYIAEGFFGQVPPPSQGNEKFWISQLNKNKVTRAQLVARYAIQTQTIAYHESGMRTFLNSAPILQIVEYAKPGEFSKPSGTPTCKSTGYKIYTDTLYTARGKVNTTRYPGGEVLRYACLPENTQLYTYTSGPVVSPTLAAATTTGPKHAEVSAANLPKTLPTLKCPVGFGVKVVGGGKEFISSYTNALVKENYWVYCGKK